MVEFRYDLFLSYATDPDYRLARDLERFLETFHEIETPDDVEIRPLEVCRDGSDFRLPSQRERRSGDAPSGSVWSIIEPRLSECRRLLVLCSPDSARSNWVDAEVAWFLENRREEDVLLAVTGGMIWA